jgi:hypothetical protein
LVKRLKRPKQNVLVIDGSSTTARAIDPRRLQHYLTRRGYGVTVVLVAAPGANHFERYAMQIVVAFPVNQKRIGTSFGKLFQVKVRVRNHQVGFQCQPSNWPEGLDDHRANRNVGHEMAIHHVDMNPIGTGLLRVRHLLAQTGKISGENRRGKFNVHIQNSSWSQLLGPQHGLGL